MMATFYLFTFFFSITFWNFLLNKQFDWEIL
ncbi:unnamed protein product, partial [Vitis vinifera]|uniref:Uncharacterized protein n=1 Tax=Vitis vinifera TaxID=29760 RepID=D7T6L0_VITVI